MAWAHGSVSIDTSERQFSLKSVRRLFGHCRASRHEIKQVSMSAMISVVLSVLVSAGALDARASGRSQHKTTTTRASKVIAYAKQLDVSRLDSTLPKQPLDQWMRDSGAPASATKWVLSDCDLKDPAPPVPLCVKFEVKQGRASILGLIKVGTQHDGVTGQPRFLGIGLTIGLAEYLESADNLSELPRLITRAKESKH
jgi:hypothetical protein